MKIKLTSVYVDDQSKALNFYTEVLGFDFHFASPFQRSRLGRDVFSLSSFLLVLLDLCPGDPCDRGGVQEHPRERTRTGGTGPARNPALQKDRVSVDKDGAVHPRSTPQSRHRAARAGALTLSAAACEVGAQSLLPTVVMRPARPISRGGSAPQ